MTNLLSEPLVMEYVDIHRLIDERVQKIALGLFGEDDIQGWSFLGKERIEVRWLDLDLYDGNYQRDSSEFPIQYLWMDDYINHYKNEKERIKKEAQERAKIEAEQHARKFAIAREKKEKADYERLKKKFEEK